ncbi:hypothetical protein H8E88_23185 [candidate division KSB1 bacterium]|nr:hypothetical protein [candidate division KSB1 bacterium]
MKLIANQSLIFVIGVLFILSCSKEQPYSPTHNDELNLTNNVLKKKYSGLCIFGPETFTVPQEKSKTKKRITRLFEVNDLNGAFIFRLVNGDGEGLQFVKNADIRLNKKRVENDHWIYLDEQGTKSRPRFPNGRKGSGYEYAKYLDVDLDFIVESTNELQVELDGKEGCYVTLEIIFQPFPLTIIDENFDSHPEGPLPKKLPLTINGKWQIKDGAPEINFQAVINNSDISPPSGSHCYEMSKNSIDLTKGLHMAAWEAWLMGRKGYQEVKIKPMQTNCFIHISNIGQWSHMGRVFFDINGKIKVDNGKGNPTYLCDYQENVWYQIKMIFDAITDTYLVLINGNPYGPFTCHETDAYYFHGHLWIGIPWQRGTAYIDDMKVVFEEAVVWQEWMDENGPG